MISPTFDSSHWTTDNFVIGTHEKQTLHWTGDCCTHTLKLHVTDTRGQMRECVAGMEVAQMLIDSGHTDVMVSIIIVITIVLLIVIVVCSVVIILIRRKRKAQLEDMRELPS